MQEHSKVRYRDDNAILLKHDVKVFKFMEEEERKVDSSRSSDS